MCPGIEIAQQEAILAQGTWQAATMRVLIADDDADVLLALELLLNRENILTVRASSPREILQLMAKPHAAIDALLIDLNYERDTTSGQEGFSLLDSLRDRYRQVPVVVMTGWGSIEGAVEAMRRGAVDYLQKPWNNVALVALLQRLLPGGRAETAALPANTTPSSPAMRQLQTLIEQVAFSDVPILITGEHGSGKELIAREIHGRSGRKGQFVALNAGAVPDGTFESELFGHVRGAFTDAKLAREGAFARAEGGTLFLDEVATMPASQQVKLLRVLQQRQYQPMGSPTVRTTTARIVSATNADVNSLARDGHFREDLMYRLNTIHLHVPPLRERLQELSHLAHYFVSREAKRHGFTVPEVDDAVLSRLQAHPWPGNVRELEHTIQRAVLLSARSGKLSEEHLGLDSASVPSASVPSPLTSASPVDSSATSSFSPTLRDSEQAAIEQALKHFPNDRQAAAKSLGLSRSAFYRRLSRYGIAPWK